MIAAAGDWRRQQAAVTVATFIGFTGFTLVMPFLPLYFAELGVRDPSANAIWSGLSLGVTPAITAAMVPAWARLAERWGRKVMVVRSLVSFAVIMAMLAAARAPWQVFALRALQGFFAGYGPLVMMMAAEATPTEHIAEAIGWVQTAQRMGPAIGPVVGGVLASTLGLRVAFLVASLLYVVAALLVVVGHRERAIATRPSQALTTAPVSLAALCRTPSFLLFLGGVFGLQLVDRSFGPILPLYLGELGVPDARVAILSGVIFTASAATAAVGNFTAGPLMRRTSVRLIVPAGGLLAAAGTAVFGYGAVVAVLIAASLVFGFGMGLATTTIYAAAGHAVPAVSRGIAIGYLTTAYLVGLAVSPVVAGFIGAASMRTVFVADTAALIALVAYLAYRMRGHGPADLGVPQNAV